MSEFGVFVVIHGATIRHADRIESCVEETMNWRYCWRAGVMSRNEGKDREKLFV